MPFPGDLRNRVRSAATANGRDAFVATLKEHDARLRSLVYKLMAGDRERTEHVLIAVYASAYEQREKAGSGQQLGTWLYRRAYTASIEELRRVRPHPRGDTGSTPAVSAAPPDPVLAGLQALPVSQRLTLILVDGEGFSLASAASILGISPERVAARLAQARATIHRHLPEVDA